MPHTVVVVVILVVAAVVVLNSTSSTNNVVVVCRHVWWGVFSDGRCPAVEWSYKSDALRDAV